MYPCRVGFPAQSFLLFCSVLFSSLVTRDGTDGAIVFSAEKRKQAAVWVGFQQLNCCIDLQSTRACVCVHLHRLTYFEVWMIHTRVS